MTPESESELNFMKFSFLLSSGFEGFEGHLQYLRTSGFLLIGIAIGKAGWSAGNSLLVSFVIVKLCSGEIY